MVSMEWRRAYPECREAKNLIDENSENFHGIFDIRRAGYMAVVDLAIGGLILVFSVLWNMFEKNQNIKPELYLAALSGVIVLSLVIYFCYCLFNISELRRAKRKVTELQDIWPAILDVVEENKDNLFLPPEPLKKSDIEVAAGIGVDEGFYRHGYIDEDMPRYIEAEEVEEVEVVEETEVPETPVAISDQATGLDYDELVSDSFVAWLLEDNGEEPPSFDELIQKFST